MREYDVSDMPNYEQQAQELRVALAKIHAENTLLLTACEQASERLKWAINLYSQAGDEGNSRNEYHRLARQARALVNDIRQDLSAAIDAARPEVVEDDGDYDNDLWFDPLNR